LDSEIAASLLKRAAVLFETVTFLLDNFIQKARTYFPRFFLLASSEVVDVLSQSEVRFC
jgi:hypothetical protein